MIIKLLLAAFAVSWAGSSNAALRCIGEDGTQVDWWLALKAPGTDRTGNTKYGYLDSDSSIVDGAYVWREGTQISGNSSNPPADTLAPLYATTNDTIGYVIWNDEPGGTHCPIGCTSFVLGHSKGTIAFANHGGFWLSHSVPKYPDSPKDSNFTGIQVGQTLNGQSFACVSLSAQSIEKLAVALQTADLNIYSPHSIPSSLRRRYPSVSKLASTALGPWGPVNPEIALSDVQIATIDGEELRVFSKSSTGDDGEEVRMWEDVVEEGLKMPMLVQTWPEGGSRDFPSYCGPPESEYESLTITKLNISAAGLEWTTRAKGSYRDHGKWAITKSSGSQGVFCMGDNNRAVHQSYRGGTSLCFTRNSALYQAVRQIVRGVQSCNETRS